MRFITLSILATVLSLSVYGQVVKFDPTKVEGQDALRLISVRGNVYLLAAAKIEGEDALVLGMGHRHGVDTCSGALVITKTRAIYNSPTRPDHNFNFVRSEVKVFEVNDWKSFGKIVYRQLTIKTDKKDYNFFPWAESAAYNLNAEDYPSVLEWISNAISDFDNAWKRFQETYEKSKPKNAVISPSGQTITLIEKYDKFKDRTTFATSAMRLTGTHASIIFQAAFWSTGTLPSKPENATLYIDADDTVRRIFKSDRSLIFLIDGTRLKLGQMEWIDSTYIPGGRYLPGSVIDELGIVIPWETLAMIANGNSVEFQVGTVEAKLDKAHTDALKKLIEKAAGSSSQK